MVTGDAIAIAKETCKTLGMGADILDAGSLGDANRWNHGNGCAHREGRRFRSGVPENKYDISMSCKSTVTSSG